MSKRVVIAVLAAGLIAGAFALSCGGKSSSQTSPAPAELNSGDIAASGGVFVHTFNTAGSFPYHCVHHANMTGTVVVAASGTPSTPGLTMVTFQPFGTTNVAVGSTVTWTNSSTAVHTVTSD